MSADESNLPPVPDHGASLPPVPDPSHASIPTVEVVEDALVVQPVVPRPPHPGFWFSLGWALLFFVVVNGTLIVSLIGILAVEALRSGDPKTYLEKLAQMEAGADEAGNGAEDEGQRIPPELGRALAPAIGIAQVTSLVFALLVVRLVLGSDWTRLLALRAPSATQVVLVLLGLPAFLLLPSLVAELARELFRQAGMKDIGYQKDLEQLFKGWPMWYGILMIGVAPGIIEELWCRGFLGRGLVGHYGPVLGVLLTSALFGLLHVDPPHVVATAVMGVALHYMYLMTRSLWVPMLLHFLNNSLAVVLTQRPDLAGEAANADVPGIVYMAAGILAAAVAYALYRARARLVWFGDTGLPPWQPLYPTVAYPPPGTSTAVMRTGPGALGWGLVLLALAILGGAVVVADAQAERQGQPDPAPKAPETACLSGCGQAIV